MSLKLHLYETTWPSGLRRVTRNHFSSGGVGSNPAVVAFCYNEERIYVRNKQKLKRREIIFIVREMHQKISK